MPALSQNTESGNLRLLELYISLRQFCENVSSKLSTLYIFEYDEEPRGTFHVGISGVYENNLFVASARIAR